ncbi:hypothetical protein [Allokutzneria sp. NRRL B-24872]|uniref:hypothetical protein n=1 Tax=Allokutzneria sp. NRRL B-24872 TaxID=1137961 RepID=UPI000A37B652|nr:hypothetical protein [Allokutzneria sp. NRRL B-24872]
MSRRVLGALVLAASATLTLLPQASASVPHGASELATPEAVRLGDDAPPSARSGTKISHATATSRLRAAGITWGSSGNCSDRNNPNCTSFDQIFSGTIDQVIVLKRSSGCALHLTGGTETGHGGGTYSHWNGYKVDFRRNDCIEGYIRRSFTKRTPTFGVEQYRSAAGNIYTREANPPHWDVLYY